MRSKVFGASGWFVSGALSCAMVFIVLVTLMGADQYTGASSMFVYGPANDATVPTKSDTASDPAGISKAIYIGTGGNLKVTTRDGTAVTFSNVQAGTVLPVRVDFVWTTGTTTSNELLLHD